MDGPLISRTVVEALLFNVADIATHLAGIEEFLEDEDDEADEG
ncbi:MAG TPA: hypothetical protein VGN06_08345 [Gaiellaceae bacterium]